MKLTFVYNAKSGKLNALLDGAHKILSPDTYSCDLCALTHGVFGEKAAWKKFREEANVEFEFIHSDEMTSDLMVGAELPVIFEREHACRVVVDAQQLANFRSVEELIRCLREYREATG